MEVGGCLSHGRNALTGAITTSTITGLSAHSGFGTYALSGGGDERNLHNRNHHIGAADYRGPYFLALGGEESVMDISIPQPTISQVPSSSDDNIIPEITHELGRYWQQPRRENILVDDTHAVMNRRDFDSLADYSRSIPSGVYPGKMWKAIMPDGRKLLCWFSSVRAGLCTREYREILILEVKNG
ncbi:hypothetical protein [Erwinia sp. JH02]|uniref:hypothetical protein n=1 Tax=Erwinia sp. JH02 TaxID=2733394 RepID=UPI0014899225|nr:hypothetical protein [Erwinia sp. JH02]NNS07311.1 hypothetical protein [Erwinia sp. JH02]